MNRVELLLKCDPLFCCDSKDEVSGTWAKVERKFASWILVVTSKVCSSFKPGNVTS